MKRRLMLLISMIICSVNVRAAGVADAMRDLLESDEWGSLAVAGERLHAADTLAELYEARAYEPVWSAEPGRLRELLAQLAGAESHGLGPSDYHFDWLSSRVAAGTGDDAAAAELEAVASDAFLLYALHLGRGKVREERIAGWHIDRPELDLHASFVAAASSGPASALAPLLPRHPGYERLRQALVRYQDIARSGGWPRIGEGPTLRLGDSGSRVAALRHRLAATGELAATPQSDVFGDATAVAVRAFQARHGLDPDGAVGPRTRAALDVAASARVEQLRVNLERWRWLEADLGDRYVLVNVAGFHAGLYDGDRLTLGMRAIVGKPYRRTPIFSDEIRYLVFSPYWNIPSSIARQEIRPKGRRYMERNDIEAVSGGRLRQRPGPGNALGRVKFMFPNRFNVYLHDTPARELFDRTSRSFSHGCIRLEKPLELARLLLDDQEWTREEIEQATGRRTPKTVQLDRRVPVHILYWTAWVDEGGTLQFRRDIYDRDRAVTRALRHNPPR